MSPRGVHLPVLNGAISAKAAGTQVIGKRRPVKHKTNKRKNGIGIGCVSHLIHSRALNLDGLEMSIKVRSAVLFYKTTKAYRFLSFLDSRAEEHCLPDYTYC